MTGVVLRDAAGWHAVVTQQRDPLFGNAHSQLETFVKIAQPQIVLQQPVKPAVGQKITPRENAGRHVGPGDGQLLNVVAIRGMQDVVEHWRKKAQVIGQSRAWSMIDEMQQPGIGIGGPCITNGCPERDKIALFAGERAVRIFEPLPHIQPQGEIDATRYWIAEADLYRFEKQVDGLIVGREQLRQQREHVAGVAVTPKQNPSLAFPLVQFVEQTDGGVGTANVMVFA